MRTYIWLFRRGVRPYQTGKFDRRFIGSHFEPYKQRYKSFVQTFYPEITWPSQSLLPYLDYAKGLRLSDPRDRIYVFMEQSRDSEYPITIQPDYNASHLEVYRQFAVQYIQTTRSARILDYVAHEIGTGTADFMPSWVPRWDIQEYSIASMPFNGTTLSPRDESACVSTVINDATLQVRGVVMETVQYISDIFYASTLTARTISDLWKVVSIMIKRSPYDACQRLKALLSMLTCCKHRGEWMQWQQTKAAFVLEAQLVGEVPDWSLRPNSSTGAVNGDSILYFLFWNWSCEAQIRCH
jgi:hypothetical protein